LEEETHMLRAALAGVLIGVTARLLMRVAALVSGSERGFEPGATIAIIALFVVAAVGSWLGARLFARWRYVGIAVTVLALLPLWLPGGSIAVVEVSSRVGGPLMETFGVILVALTIVGCMVGAPLRGWQAGRRPRAPRVRNPA
jgi:hypothetical protein